MVEKKLRLLDKVFLSVLNGVEQFAFSENFNISNLSSFDEIFQDGIMSVRHYHPLEDDEIEIAGEKIKVEKKRHKTPVILVPPLAATSMIFDLMPHRSVVRYFLANGYDVYLVDWGDVTADHKNLSLESYVLEWMPMIMDAVITHSDEEEVSIFAYCMGGLLSLMYLAVSGDESVKNLVTVASPIDMHQSGAAGKVLSAIYKPAHLVSNVLNFSLLDLPTRYFHVPGWTSSLVFKLTNPMGSVINTYEKFLNLWDREYLEESLTMSKWFDDMVDYPGRTIREMAVHMMINNTMAKGKMRIGKVMAEFNQIRCSILAFAGESDNLVSVSAAHKVLDIVSSEDKEFCVVPGGHAGVFAGNKAPQNTWRIAVDWLASRSD
ncbi:MULTISPECIES: alpha/beta fold hydrolase [unclassified Oleiphilus]|uniref:alpha/beta fold hydrolase n=4 Tax=Oleiphilus TaxID=141450 RepID=UPI0007C24F02|nr:MULTISPECIES: alpha/beta fold hydrolase [unclassified Oleiphilus]KZY33419.1 alpha/beta hydrolase [Oleiphilus sp. HI0043]KZY45229.1 alpha/beta hydrolase [Oleiphilus sp. HI0050]KZY64525.1 alpha/beta hydrolase [Oleiphilus sp. HI0061]KZY77932.1 alpha/beta hydrolase [Oleiphilus sp. HI0068]KZY86293.1 alpha/beta hydrolase [Oleiphilus sp. HI0069]KZY86694.1 alpha/beta hydrolase [Oleiphilus sp. HI0072]KZZ06825.1 alpha/beta hydrolase [Oleiphilus sp. HI0078]KZZ34757.1 alpha/beta hydrolase [Oleiphilu